MFNNSEGNLMANVLALRERLMKTETSLQILGEELHSDNSSKHSDSSSQCSFPARLTLEDLMQPDYTEPAMSRLLTNSGRMAHLNDAVRTGSSNCSKDKSFCGASTSSRIVEQENEQLRRKLSTIREENTSLVTQNHYLMNEIESVQFELTQSKTKLHLLESSFGTQASCVPELEEQVAGLEAEVEAQENALRDAEKRLEESQKMVTDREQTLQKFKEKFQKLEFELLERNKQKKRAEQQRNVALLNAEQLTVAFRQHKEKVAEKLTKVQAEARHLHGSLIHSENERKELQRNCDTFEKEVEDLRRQIRQLKEEPQDEKVKVKDLETEIDKLNKLLMHSNKKIQELEKDLTKNRDALKEKDVLVKENTELRSLTTSQSSQLLHCQQEIEETKTVLSSLESIISQQPQIVLREVNDITTNAEPSSSSSIEEDVGGESQLLITDLRIKLAMKDTEIQKLKSKLMLDKASQHLSLNNQNQEGSTLHDVQVELLNFIKKSQAEERKFQELEPILSQLEKERQKHTGQVVELQAKLTEAETEISSLKTRMTQRTNQFQVIQEELLEKAAETTDLERELKKKCSQLSILEKQIEDKTIAASSSAARIIELEQELLEKNNQILSLEKNINKEHEDITLALENAKRVHIEQYRELEKQIELLQGQVEQKQLQLSERERTILVLQQDITASYHKAESLDHMLTEATEEIEKQKKMNDEALKTLQNQAVEGTTKVRQLEAALAICKEELKLYLHQLEDNKEQFEEQLKKRSDEVQRLQKELKTVRDQLQETSEQNVCLQQTLQQQQQMLQHCTGRIGELEDSQAQLEKLVSRLEQDLQKQREVLVEELEKAEGKLRKAHHDIDYKNQQVAELTSAINQIRKEMDQCKHELTEMERELLQLRRDSTTKNIQLNQMEISLQETQTELDKKADLVIDLEEKLHRSEADRRNSLQRAQGLQSELQNVQVELQDTLEQLQELKDVLQKAQSALGEKSTIIKDLNSELRQCKSELEEKDQELLDMDQALKERNWDLKQRAAQVTQLDMTIREHKTELEQKIIRLEGGLEKAALETKERGKQVEMLDEKLQFSKDQLREKDFELLQMEQQFSQVKNEIVEKEKEIANFKMVVKEQEQHIGQQQQEVLEQGQQVRLAREQMQRAHLDIMEARRQLCLTQREADRLSRELDEAIHLSQEKEAHVNHLAEELGALQACEAQMEVKMKMEAQKLKEEMADLKDSHQKELSLLQESQAQLLFSTESQQSSNQQLNSQLHHMKQELEEARNGIFDLQTELQAKNEAIRAANDAILLRESEVTRLQARISKYERAMEIQQSSDFFTLSPQKQSSISESDSRRYSQNTFSSYENLHRVISSSDTQVNNQVLPTGSLNSSGSILEDLMHTVIPPNPVMKSDYGLCGRTKNSLHNEFDIQDDNSFNPLTYSVDEDGSLNATDIISESGNLESLTGMLEYVNQEIRMTAESNQNKTAPYSGIAGKCG
ncbi:coiled-coil domain-containing protein 18 [Latimeria chalumnae]|uniref:coiled-coil domain-containing protein 18 n=1 Tax=Latimeria chalumnae TaxID=7897 RepID=UPI0003C1554E|nr:PREDICTED: coiled-coil domain-containing protein 18 isoform X2 [Latimeria chalumnae]|eukprot:XP_006001650.1 PREDICTED: coiled-coil domain-containing protein 18 isoform X2 [Latimeria chalumnae]